MFDSLQSGMPARHPLTGAPILPLGVTRRGTLIWPVMGGSQPVGEPPAPGPHPGPAHPPAPVPAPPGPAPHPNPANPPGQPGQPNPPSFGPGQVNDNGYPEHTPVAAMTPEQQAAYWRTYARRNEDRLKAMGDYTQLKEQADAYQKLLADTQTVQEKAVAAAEQRGRATALAEAGSQMVEAYVRAAASGRMAEEQVSTLLQGLDRTRFVNPATGQVDAQMISAYVAMLAPATGWQPAPAYAPPIPGTGMAPQIPGSPYAAAPAAPVPAPQLTYPGQPQWGGVYPPQPQQQQPGPPATGEPRQVPSYGQAQYPNPPVSGFEAGKAFARARFGTTK